MNNNILNLESMIDSDSLTSDYNVSLLDYYKNINISNLAKLNSHDKIINNYEKLNIIDNNYGKLNTVHNISNLAKLYI